MCGFRPFPVQEHGNPDARLCNAYKRTPADMQPYSEHEAKSAFSRMLSHHKSNGW